jgi:hypothetical protein
MTKKEINERIQELQKDLNSPDGRCHLEGWNNFRITLAAEELAHLRIALNQAE